MGKESTCNAIESNSWVRKTPWRRAWQPTPALLPGEFHGQRSLSSYNPKGHKESDMTERLIMHAGYFLFKHVEEMV